MTGTTQSKVLTKIEKAPRVVFLFDLGFYGWDVQELVTLGIGKDFAERGEVEFDGAVGETPAKQVRTKIVHQCVVDFLNVAVPEKLVEQSFDSIVLASQVLLCQLPAFNLQSVFLHHAFTASNKAGFSCYPTNLRNPVRQQIREELFGESDGDSFVFGSGAALMVFPIVPASTPPERR